VNILGSSWFYWAAGVAVGLPAGRIILTELHLALVRRQSYLAEPINLLRTYLLPLGALLLLLIKAARVPAQDTSVRVVATVIGFVVLVLLLSGLTATLFQGAPQASWRRRVPAIFLDVARLGLIGVGLAMILSYVWGVRVAGLFTALGVTSVVIGLMLQNSVGQIVSGLFMLFEQPFRIGDWLDTPTVVAPALRLSHTDQQSLMPYARIVRYGTDELVQCAGEVPTGMTFLITGSVRLTTVAEDGSVVSLNVLEEGSLLGLTTLTRQPNFANAYAREEVTALEVNREHIEDVVMRTPLLLQELGRMIEDRRKETARAGYRERLGSPRY
jgi:hypothetical protein